MRLACIYMASGYGRRFGSNKLFAPLNGRPLYRWGLDCLLGAGRILQGEGAKWQLIVVSQYWEILQAGREAGAVCVENRESAQGISASIRLGTAAASWDTDAYLYAVADQPYLRLETIVRLVRRFAACPAGICCVRSGGRPGNPAIFAGSYREALLGLLGDRGGSQIIRLHPADVAYCDAPKEELRDVDEPGDLL